MEYLDKWQDILIGDFISSPSFEQFKELDIDILQDFLVDLLLSDQEKMDKFFRMERRMERRMESLNKLEI